MIYYIHEIDLLTYIYIYYLYSYQGAFNFPFSIGRNTLSVVQHGDRFELRINN
jgi:hypothetical protein